MGEPVPGTVSHGRRLQGAFARHQHGAFLERVREVQRKLAWHGHRHQRADGAPPAKDASSAARPQPGGGQPKRGGRA